jgi:hypothetical protein
MKLHIRSLLSITAVTVLAVSLTACGTSKIKVPDLAGSDLDSAKILLTNLGLVPIVTEEYSDDVAEDAVIGTEPNAGFDADPSAQVTILISKGPKLVYSANSTMQWTYVSYGEDEWQFENPYIEDGKLHIKFTNVKLQAVVKWKDEQGNGYGFGLASITDTFNKTVPLQINWERQYSNFGQSQDLEVVVPMTDLDVQRPTNLYMKLYAYIDGSDEEVKLDLSITW